VRRTFIWLREAVVRNRVWRSIVRHGYPDTPLDQSLAVFSNFFLHVQPVKVHRHTLRATYTFGLGLIAFYLFVVLVVTGAFLMFYYVPSVDRAYADMKDLEFVVSFGLLLRNLHRWTAHGMVAVAFLHMCRVFYTGSYKPPREFNWVVGVLLLVVTFLLSFTGYLLPWDQLAFWAITVGTSIAGYMPFVGSRVRYFLLGGNQVGQNALLRFYVLHVMLLPLIATVLVGIHFWRIRKDGGLSRPAAEDEDSAHAA
jgi:quinol-cytochrome oxidoreductase complex cytochrome b subunit